MSGTYFWLDLLPNDTNEHLPRDDTEIVGI